MMAIREDIVASAANFLQDPTVSTTPVEKKIAFLQAKNLTPDEVNAALVRVGLPPAVPSQALSGPVSQQPAQAFYNNQSSYPQQYGYGWQPQALQQAPPRRDWRDWFIMATVVSGVSYGLYSLGKHYVYPLIAPPTPDRLKQAQEDQDEQFEKMFALVDQVVKDNEELKASEAARTAKLDTTIGELDTVMGDLKSANRRRDDEAQRIRDEIQNLKELIPRAMNNQKEMTDDRLRELNSELKSLKTLITQRLNQNGAAPSTSSFMRPGLGGVGTSTTSTPAVTPAPAAVESSKEEPKTTSYQDLSTVNNPSRTASPFGTGIPTKAAIPAWQLMAANKNASSTAGAASSSSSAPAANSTSDAGSSGTSTP